MLAGRPKSVVYPRCPVPIEGRCATSSTWSGMRWTRTARETSADCLRTVKSCGSDAPILGVKPVRRSAGDGVKQRGHRGEREVSRKTIARGMPGRSGVTVVTNSYACFILHARLRVHWAPGIPCALCFLWANVLQKLGQIAPRECGVAVIDRCQNILRVRNV